MSGIGRVPVRVPAAKLGPESHVYGLAGTRKHNYPRISTTQRDTSNGVIAQRIEQRGSNPLMGVRVLLALQGGRRTLSRCAYHLPSAP